MTFSYHIAKKSFLFHDFFCWIEMKVGWQLLYAVLSFRCSVILRFNFYRFHSSIQFFSTNRCGLSFTTLYKATVVYILVLHNNTAKRFVVLPQWFCLSKYTFIQSLHWKGLRWGSVILHIKIQLPETGTENFIRCTQSKAIASVLTLWW